jgi:hypothetical protein
MKGKTMYIRNTKTKAVHRALSGYLRPRLKDNRAVDFTPLFHNLHDGNIAGHVEDLIGGAIRLTAGALAYDASPTELRQTMKQALRHEDGTTMKNEDGDVVEKVLELLAHKLLPHELAAVRQILTQRRTPSRKAAAASRDPEMDVAEDIAAFDHRFPSAARLAVEPVARPERQPQPASEDYEGFYARFPSTRRIGF